MKLLKKTVAEFINHCENQRTYFIEENGKIKQVIVDKLDVEDGKMLIDQLGVDNLPRNAYFGDGSEISLADIDKINAVIEQEKFFFPWQKGDILLIDNLLMNHGRNPFEGSRKVAVAMANVWDK